MSFNKIYGMTMVELIVVLIILVAVLGFTVPIYVNLTHDARQSAVLSVAGALAVSNAMNYTLRRTNRAQGIPISNCNNVSDLLAGGLPSNFVIRSEAVLPGSSVSCTLTDIPKIGNKVDANFFAFGIS